MVVGSPEPALDKALRRGRALFARNMREAFPEIEWRVPLVTAPDPSSNGTATAEAVTLLDAALQEREGRRWDFALAFYAGELRGYDRPAPLGAPSAAIGCATAGGQRLWEPCDDPGDKECRRRSVELASGRAAALAAHLLGHLAGLGHAADPADYLYPPHAVADLDRMTGFAPETLDDLRRELLDVADPRLEEEEPNGVNRFGAARFAARAAWRHRDDVRRIVKRIRPWTIPRRLGGLVTAAASTLVVLMMTAEAWEAGMSQPAWRVVLLAAASLTTASAYLVVKQRLLIHRPRGGRVHPGRPAARHSEQRSVGNVAVVLAVSLGMLLTYAALFAVSLAAAVAFYPAALVESWAGTVARPLGWEHYLCLCGTVAALGLTIGALGAGFEPRGYVRHVAYVDEEV